MKTYQSFLSEQKEFISEASAKNRSSATTMAGLAGTSVGKNAADTVVFDGGNVLTMDNYAYDWANFISSLPALSVQMNHEQMVKFLKGMSLREREKVASYVKTLKNFQDQHTMELLSTTLKKAQIMPETRIPGNYGKWGR